MTPETLLRGVSIPKQGSVGRQENRQAEVSNLTGTQSRSAPLLWCPKIPALVPQTSCCSRSVSLSPLWSLQGVLAPHSGGVR